MFESKAPLFGRRGLPSLTLALVLVIPILVSVPASAHEIEIQVLGKNTRVHPIPSALGESFFTLFRGTSARLGDEVAYQLGQVDESGFRMRRLKSVFVEPNLYFALDGASSSSFTLGVSGFPLTASAEFRCPVTGCNHVDVHVDLDDVEATGTYDYFNGHASLTIVPPNPDIDLDADLTLLAGILAGWLFNIAEAVAESLAESAVRNALQVVSVDGQFLGLTEILESLPSSLISQLGVNPLELLQNPLLGLSIDISLIAPKSFSVPGRIDMLIHHRRLTSVSSSVITSIGNNKKPRISWSSVPGATQYKVYSKEGYSGQWTYRATTGATSWSDSSVSHPDLEVGHQGGQTFEYRVVAVNSLGIESIPTAAQRFSLPPEGGGGGGDDGDGGPAIAF